MGETYATLEVVHLNDADFQNPRKIKALVDTGATLSVIPSKILKELKINTIETVSITLADGRTITRKLGHVLIRINGRTRVCSVVSGKKNDPPLVGLTTLELVGLTVDPVRERLVSIKSYHQY